MHHKSLRSVLVLLLSLGVLFLPQLVGASGESLPGSGWWTGEQVQNVGASPATIVATLYLPTTSCAVTRGPLTGSTTFLPGDFSCSGPGDAGGILVSADQPIKGIVSVTNRQVGPYGVLGGLAGGQYAALESAATSIRFPLVKKVFGGGNNIKTTTLFVQNAGATATTPSATFACNTGSFNWTAPGPINMGQMVAISMNAVPGMPTGSLCSGTVTASQPIAGVAAEHYSTETVATLVQSTHSLTTSDYDTTLYAPIFKKQFPLSGLGSGRARTTGAQVQNVDIAALDITATYYGSPGTPCAGVVWSETVTNVAPGASANFLNPAGLAQGCLASATFTSTGNIAGIVNEAYLNPQPPAGIQSATSYNMAPAHTATTLVSVPLFKEQWGGKTSGLQVQNVTTTTATIHVVFASGTNTYTTINYTVAGGQSKNFYLMANCGAGCWVGTAMPANTNSSALVYSDQPIIAGIAEQPYTVANPNCFGQALGPCYDRQNYEGFNLTP